MSLCHQSLVDSTGIHSLSQLLVPLYNKLKVDGVTHH